MSSVTTGSTHVCTAINGARRAAAASNANAMAASLSGVPSILTTMGSRLSAGGSAPRTTTTGHTEWVASAVLLVSAQR